jgi:hypothetical protein
LVEAFVEQHFHSILRPIVGGNGYERTHLEWNKWLDQMSGFGVGNQSTDALMIAVFWNWKHAEFQVRERLGNAVPNLRRANTPESEQFYNFDEWVRQLRADEKLMGNRPHTEHEMFRRQASDDRILTTSRMPSSFFKLHGYMHSVPDRQIYKSEPFCVMVPDDNKLDLKTHRYTKVHSVYSFRGNLLFKAARDIRMLSCVNDPLQLQKIENAFTFLVLRPFNSSRPSGLRSANYCTEVVDVSLARQFTLHPKQKRTGTPFVYVSSSHIELPGSKAAAAHLHKSREWRRLAMRLKRSHFKQTAAVVLREHLKENNATDLDLVQPPDLWPLSGEVLRDTYLHAASPTPCDEDAFKRSAKKIPQQACDLLDATNASQCALPALNVKPTCRARTKKKQKKGKSTYINHLQSMIDDEFEFVSATPSYSHTSHAPVLTTGAAMSALDVSVDDMHPVHTYSDEMQASELFGDSTDDSSHEEKDCTSQQTKLHRLRYEWRSSKNTAAFDTFVFDKNTFSSSSSEGDSDGDDNWEWQLNCMAKSGDASMPKKLKRILNARNVFA